MNQRLELVVATSLLFFFLIIDKFRIRFSFFLSSQVMIYCIDLSLCFEFRDMRRKDETSTILQKGFDVPSFMLIPVISVCLRFHNIITIYFLLTFPRS